MENIIHRLRGWHSDGSFNVDVLGDWLDCQGVEVLGMGAFGAVIDCDLFVIKIFDATDMGYISFLNFCETVGKNRYLPEIYFHQKISKYLHIAMIEKLEAFGSETDKEYLGIRQYGQRWGRKAEAEKLNAEVTAILELMKTYKDAYNQVAADHNSTADWKVHEYMSELCHDVHSGNVMLREKQLVITDPWCV